MISAAVLTWITYWNSLTEFILKMYSLDTWSVLNAVTANADINQKKWNLVATDASWKLPSNIVPTNIGILASLNCQTWKIPVYNWSVWTCGQGSY